MKVWVTIQKFWTLNHLSLILLIVPFEILTDEFFNSNIGNLDTLYISHEEHKNLNVNGSADKLSVLHLNIKSIKKEFKNFKTFLSKFWLQNNMFFGDMVRQILFDISIPAWVT